MLVLTYGVGVILYCFNKIVVQGKPEYLLLFFCLFAPAYTTILSLAYQLSGTPLLVAFFKYAKEVLTLGALAVFVFGRRKPLDYGVRMYSLDYAIMVFLALALVFALMPIGPSSFVNKAVYFKNLLLLGIMYFLGRNIKLSYDFQKKIFNAILATLVLAFIVTGFEKLTNTHFQSIIGYSAYNQDIMDIEPTGNYGLQWTFEAAGGVKRFAAFFHSPLALASSMLLTLIVAFALFTSVKYRLNKLKYLLLMLLAVMCLIFAYSRAAIGGIFLAGVFLAFTFGYRKLIYTGLLSLLVFWLYVVFLAPEDVRYYVFDTISFSDSSSLGHIAEWIEGIETATQNPLGYGLATSGNVGGVDEDLQVGGENQYIIFAVQLGIPGLIVYLSVIFLTISVSLRAYRMSDTRQDKLIPLITASFKFGLLFLMMFSNTENYGNISYLIWWFAGTSVAIYSTAKYDSSLKFKYATN
ncbi:hypothetical protein BFP71_03610 [Roseivirga misakiensis]|uniref:O-antigen ligase-related domain-containing protein n=1 Tax=Roseivirga misakiensis TaxID=1563681 RepID=A0A1E5T7C7_9BACT|nr:hypothetical protein BFP71_03610 [Roseivirga misakiensis]